MTIDADEMQRQNEKAWKDHQGRTFSSFAELMEPRLRGLHYDDGNFIVELEPGPAFELLAMLCVKSLSDTPNFKTMDVCLKPAGSSVETFNFTLSRVGGKSVSDKLREQREEIESLKSEIERLKNEAK